MAKRECVQRAACAFQNESRQQKPHSTTLDEDNCVDTTTVEFGSDLSEKIMLKVKSP